MNTNNGQPFVGTFIDPFGTIIYRVPLAIQTQKLSNGEAVDDCAWIGNDAMKLLHADAVCCTTLEQKACHVCSEIQNGSNDSKTIKNSKIIIPAAFLLIQPGANG